MQVVVSFDASIAQSVFNALASGSFRGNLLTAVGGVAQRQTVERFGTKVSPDGAPWAPWVGRGSNRRGRGLLVETGRLRGSITNIVSGNQVIVGTNVFYARFHQGGTSKMVARPFVGANEENIAEIGQVLVGYLRSIFG